MDFKSIVKERQSCRAYDATRPVEQEKLDAILSAARLAPSACNAQPYHVTVCKGERAHEAAQAVQGMGMNRFASDAPALLVISEAPYNATAAIGAKFKGNDYRSIDIGILTAYITCAATEEGLSTCILGWLDDKRLRALCSIDAPVRLVITLGYAKEGDPLRDKKRKPLDALVTLLDA